MRLLGKVLVAGAMAGAGLASFAFVWRTLRARATAEPSELETYPVPDEPVPNLTEPTVQSPTMFKGGGAGAMSADEVALGAGIARPTRPNIDPDAFDPEEVPTEHPELDELREKMPFG
jgi:hypothetical protein